MNERLLCTKDRVRGRGADRDRVPTGNQGSAVIGKTMTTDGELDYGSEGLPEMHLETGSVRGQSIHWAQGLGGQ